MGKKCFGFLSLPERIKLENRCSAVIALISRFVVNGNVYKKLDLKYFVDILSDSAKIRVTTRIQIAVTDFPE